MGRRGRRDDSLDKEPVELPHDRPSGYEAIETARRRLMLTHKNYLKLTLGKLAAGIGHP